nr:MBL fold metallo-hydrolase [Candidatus Levybacteria bacterium]
MTKHFLPRTTMSCSSERDLTAKREARLTNNSIPGQWVRGLLFASVLFLLGGIFLYQNQKFNDGKLHFIVCDVGQGDGILIRTSNGSDILIDGGPDDSILNCLQNHMPFWDRDIEVMMLTHPHADHLTGLISVLKRYKVMHYVTENLKYNSLAYRKLQDVLAKNNLTAKFNFSGDRIDFADKTSLLTIWPKGISLENQELQDSQNLTKDNPSLDVNGFSLIELLSYGNFKVLLTGDAGVLVEDKIANSIGKIDVLKVPHHGSKTGMSDLFLSEINPKLAIISVGAKNRYGHPAKIALDLLAKYNIKMLRTDKNGEVEVVSDGKSFKVYAN